MTRDEYEEKIRTHIFLIDRYMSVIKSDGLDADNVKTLNQLINAELGHILDIVENATKVRWT